VKATPAVALAVFELVMTGATVGGAAGAPPTIIAAVCATVRYSWVLCIGTILANAANIGSKSGKLPVLIIAAASANCMNSWVVLVGTIRSKSIITACQSSQRGCNAGGKLNAAAFGI